MWFLFGFITLGAFCIWSLRRRRDRAWRGEERRAGPHAYELRMTVKDGSVGHAEIGVRCRAGFSFALTPEDDFDRWGKAIGLTQECQTGDKRFDDAIYVQSGDPALHHLLQSDPRLRDAILTLQAECNRILGGLRAIEVHGGRAWVSTIPRENDVADVEAGSTQLVPTLNAFAERLSRQRIGQAPGRDLFPLRAACLLAISTGLALYGGVALFLSVPIRPFVVMANPAAPVSLAVPTGICIGALLALAALAWLRRSTRTHLVLLEVIFIGMPGAILTAYDRFHDFNIDLDRDAPAMIEAEITGLHETTAGRRRRYCHMELSGWPSATRGASVEIPCYRYRRLSVGQRVDMEQHPGALGWPWVSDFHPR
jgi:hypothetical protein